MRDPVRIKQLLPITDGYCVLTSVTDGHGKMVYKDMTKDGWHYLFALTDGGEWDDDRVGVYEMDAEGYGEITGSAFRIVQKRKCPYCDSEMKVSWDSSKFEPSYTCPCNKIRSVNKK